MTSSRCILLVPNDRQEGTTMAEHLYKSGTIWWGYVYDQTSGARIARSTKCKDKLAAERGRALSHASGSLQ
jgi:hypothetical protein